MKNLWRSNAFRIGLGAVVSLFSFYLALRNVPLVEVKEALGQARLEYAALAVLLVFANNLAKVLRWRVLLGKEGRSVCLGRLTASHLAGQALNLIYPARMGEISRVYVVGRQGISRVFVLGTIAFEKLFDLLAFSLLFIWVLVLIPLPGWIDRSTSILAGVTVLIFLLILFAASRVDGLASFVQVVSQRTPLRIQNLIQPRLAPALSSLGVLQDRRAFLQLSFWTLVVWGTALFTNYAALLAMDLTLPVTASLLLLIVLQAGVTIPSIPARLGLFEYLCVLSLAVFGVDQALALGFGFLLHAVALLPTLLPGLICVAFLGGASPEQKIEGKNVPVLEKEVVCQPGQNP